MQRQFVGLLGAGLVAAMTSCAMVIPDYNANKVINEKKTDSPITIVMSPWGGQICDAKEETDIHTRTINFVITQNIRPIQHLAFSDNKQGKRFEGHQSISVTVGAGIGMHEVLVGMYTYDEAGEIVVEYITQKKYEIICCHKQHSGIVEG